jgi:predicted anti-sigma-YlaC factor YlaD
MEFRGLHASADALEEVSEEYLFGRLSLSETAAFEDHLRLCSQCREAVEDAAAFIRVFRAAAAAGSSPGMA